MQAECRIAKLSRGHARDANIDRHRLHVQAVLRHAVPVRAEEFVAPRSAVTAYHVDLGVRATKRRSQIMEQIEYPRIVLANIAGSVIA